MAACLILGSGLFVGGCLDGGVRVGFSDTAEESDAPDTDTDVADSDTPDSDVPDSVVADTVAPDTGTPCASGTRRCWDDSLVEVCLNGSWVAEERCSEQTQCIDGGCQCVPRCEGRACGPDLCGGTCGGCDDTEVCSGGQCVCIPQCGGRACGADGCGGQCGTCDGMLDACIGGQCECRSDCGDKQCGVDGCGNICGACGSGFACNVAGECVCSQQCGMQECGIGPCGQACGTCEAGAVCTADNVCVVPPPIYRALYIEDRWNGQCNNSNSAGADIDAAALFRANGDLVGYFSNVRGRPGTEGCQNDAPNVSTTQGAPQAGQAQDYLTLQGGWVAGRFQGNPQIRAGMTVTVYEFDQPAAGGNPDPFAIYLSTNLQCPDRDDRYETCLFLLDDNAFGTTDAVVPMSAF